MEVKVKIAEISEREHRNQPTKLGSLRAEAPGIKDNLSKDE